jgi:hypothetical protein
MRSEVGAFGIGSRLTRLVLLVFFFLLEDVLVAGAFEELVEPVVA